jgi:hypothetical protein
MARTPDSQKLKSSVRPAATCLYGYYDYGYYGGDCSIAYRNARASSSSYWWNRYYACVGYSY